MKIGYMYTVAGGGIVHHKASGFYKNGLITEIAENKWPICSLGKCKSALSTDVLMEVLLPLE